MPLYKQWNSNYKDSLNTTRSSTELEDKFPSMVRFFTYYNIEEYVISNILINFITRLSRREYADIEWSCHIMRDKFDMPLKVFLVKFKRRANLSK
jgi:hypothetical protein